MTAGSTMAFVRKASTWLLLGLCCWPLALVSAQDKPNFIFMFTDDLGLGDLKVYGHPYAKTDNLDRLAAEGTLFRDFHTTGNICPNSRTGFMTSRYPSWFANYTPEYGFKGAITVTKLLQDAGYVTGHIGKWNIGPTPDEDDTEHVEYGISHLRITSDGRSDPRGKEGERYDEAIKFVEEYQDVPFYLNIWMYAPHSPIEPPEYLMEPFDGIEVDESLFGVNMQPTFDNVRKYGANVNKSMRTYLGEVYGLDMQIGRLMDKLDELGLAENTVVVFSSDNGPAKIDNRGEAVHVGWAGGLRGGKHRWYEGGITVPFIVRWPAAVPAGKVSLSHFSALDWLPTICTLAGVEVPWDMVQGEDVSDIWKGSDRSRVRPTFYQDPGSSKTAVRYANWKFHDYSNELFDLDTDKEELVNLYDERPDVVAAMEDIEAQWKATLPDKYAFSGGSTVAFDPTEPATKIAPPEQLLVTTDTGVPTVTPPTGEPTTAAPTSEVTAGPTAEPTTAATTQPSAVAVLDDTSDANGTLFGLSKHVFLPGLFFLMQIFA